MVYARIGSILPSRIRSSSKHILAALSSATLLSATLGLTGCDSLGKSHNENPVMAAAPPRRMAISEIAQNEIEIQHINDSLNPQVASLQPGQVVPTSGQFIPPAGVLADEISGSQVVATVNGQPILADDILEKYSGFLERMQQEAPPSVYNRERLNIIKRDLNSMIDRRLLIEALRATIKPKQFESAIDQLGNMWEQEQLSKLKEKLKVNSRHEVEVKLAEQRMSLDLLRSEFINQALAVQFLQQKAKGSSKPPREELLAYYRENIKDYEFKGRVRWQHIVIRDNAHSSKAEAADVFSKVVAELKQQVPFEEVAKKYSDASTKNDGGVWGWSKQGNLANKELEKTLWSLPVGLIGGPVTVNGETQVVRVLEREDAGRQPFQEVQDAIEDKITNSRRKNASDAVLKDLKSRAEIITIFDDQPGVSGGNF